MKSIRAWTLPLMVAAVFIPGAAGFYLGDGGLSRVIGVGLGLGLVINWSCRRPLTPLVSAAPADRRGYLLAMVCPVADGDAVAARIKDALRRREQPSQTAVRLVAPVKASFLERWGSDLDARRAEAQEKLRGIGAMLADAGIAVDARVGDEDVVQAVEDEINAFPATEVVLLTGLGEDAAKVRETSEELRSRLVAAFRHVVVPEGTVAPDTARPPYRPEPAVRYLA